MRARAVVLCTATVLVVAACGPREPLPKLGAVPAFALTDQAAAPFTEARLRGKVSVVNFLFTSCPTICPVLTERTRALQPKLAPWKGQAQIVSFSVDPEKDTPAVLAAYARKHGADPSLWTFVTGDIKVLGATVEQGFKVAVGQREVRAAGGYDILHSSHYALVDQTGVLRGFYSSDDEDEAKLLADLERLTEETP
jgi:protein SCO1/2